LNLRALKVRTVGLEESDFQIRQLRLSERFFAVLVLSVKERCFASLSMTKKRRDQNGTVSRPVILNPSTVITSDSVILSNAKDLALLG